MSGDDNHVGSSFAQGGTQVPGRDGKVKDLTCWNCNKPGHIKPQCPDLPARNTTANEGKKSEVVKGSSLRQWAGDDEIYDDDYYDDEEDLTGSSNVMIGGANGYCNAQSAAGGNDCIDSVGDTGASHHTVCNSKLLSGIKHSDKPLELHTNAGEFHCHSKGLLPAIGPVWYHPEGFINVISLGLMEMSERHEVIKGGRGNRHFMRLRIRAPEGVLSSSLRMGCTFIWLKLSPLRVEITLILLLNTTHSLRLGL